MTAALAIDGLEISAQAGPLVRGVSLQIAPGRPLTLIGETGSGKTLVAQAIAGQLAPELAARGRIVLGGIDILNRPSARRRLPLRLAVLPQEPWLSLDPTMPARGQVAEVFRYVRGLASPAARRAAQDSLAALGIAAAGLRYPFQLSGGMCQRVALAMTRAAAPHVLLADEPTKGLDHDLRAVVVAQLREEIAADRAVLTITHDLAVARALGGDIAVMLDGQIVEQGPADAVLAAPRHDYTRRLVAADPQGWPPPEAPAAGPPVIAGRGLAKSFGAHRLFAAVDVAVGAGEIVALTGGSGSGKTTIGNILLGLVAPDAGRVEGRCTDNALRFQKVYQDPPAAFAPARPVGRSIADLARRRGLSAAARDGLLARLHLGTALLARRPGQLSGGELQRLALLRALLVDPVFLFADEPTSRLDPLIQKDVMALLREIAADRGVGMLLVTHDRVLAAKTAARTLALADGRVA